MAEVRGLILEARQQTARTVNAGLTLLYWQVGDRIQREILQEKRAEYGAEIVLALSAQLELEFGRGFGEKSLRRMVQFAASFSDPQIVATLSRQLGWSHFKEILPLPDPLQRNFYAEMCRIERWSVRDLRSRIDSMLYERTALSKKPEKLIAREIQALRERDQLTPDLVFRDPYVLDFLGLRDTYGERDLEDALLREIESFLLELGIGFAFVERYGAICWSSTFTKPSSALGFNSSSRRSTEATAPPPVMVTPLLASSEPPAPARKPSPSSRGCRHSTCLPETAPGRRNLGLPLACKSGQNEVMAEFEPYRKGSRARSPREMWK